MREIGWIKWFGGHNYRTGKENAYGFIERPAETDVYVHRHAINTSLANLQEGVAVTFDLCRGRGGKDSAANVRLLREESDIDTRARALAHDNPSFFKPSIERITELLLPAKSAQKIAKVLERRIHISILFGGITATVRTLSHPILQESSMLRQCLPPVEHLEFCLKYLGTASQQSVLKTKAPPPTTMLLPRKT
jgi:cold shock CspA family protein